MATINWKDVQPLIDKGYISARPHYANDDLLILNYTPRAQYDRLWTEETLMCRGLIVRKDGTIVARPFRKFFNIEEHTTELPDEPFEVLEKLDGSLGISYPLGDSHPLPYVATRGSFMSDQAYKATEILHAKYGATFLPQYDPTKTYLWEIIYPENRIVVDYGKIEDLILLAVINTEDGAEVPYDELGAYWPGPIARRYDGVTDVQAIRELGEDNQEGFVIRFTGPSNLRVKAKMPDYVRLHRVLTGVTARDIWEHLKNHQSLNTLLENVPDEFYAWVKAKVVELSREYARLHREAKEAYRLVEQTTTVSLPFTVGDTLTFKQAKTVLGHMNQAVLKRYAEYPEIETVLTSMYLGAKGEKIEAMIWDLIYPPAEKPFKVDDEG